MKARTFAFRFRALSPKAWSDLLAAHPSKDKTKIFEANTFPDAAIRACCVEPAGLDDDARFAALLSQLSVAQQSDLFDGAWAVNTSAPKGLSSFGASPVPPHSAKNSGSAAA